MGETSESRRENLRWFQREHALEIFRQHRLRVLPDARPRRAHPDQLGGDAQLSDDVDGAIVEYINDRGRWEPAKVTWETFRALPHA